MYYQTQSISEDNIWTSCLIKDVIDDKYIVEYVQDGKFLTKELHPEDIQNLDYSESEVSQ
jgi:hypothetical protein